MGMALLKRLAAWLSDLRLAIVLLLLIALASAVGTGIPRGIRPPATSMPMPTPPGWGCSTANRFCSCSSIMCIPAAGFWPYWPGWVSP